MNTGSALLIVVAIVATVCGGIGLLVVSQLRARRLEAQILDLLATLGPVAERARSDPRVLLAWFPIAEAARRRFPEAFETLDQSDAGRFPFDEAHLDAAHTRWTADWLEWERDHDAEYRQKSDAIETQLAQSAGAEATPLRAQLEVVEREKLERYQRRYEDYVRTSRALEKLQAPVS